MDNTGKLAQKYAIQAVELDNNGEKEKAIQSYQKAINFMVKIIHQNPTSKLNQIYKEKCHSYQNRIKMLENLD